MSVKLVFQRFLIVVFYFSHIARGCQLQCHCSVFGRQVWSIYRCCCKRRFSLLNISKLQIDTPTVVALYIIVNRLLPCLSGWRDRYVGRGDTSSGDTAESVYAGWWSGQPASCQWTGHTGHQRGWTGLDVPGTAHCMRWKCNICSCLWVSCWGQCRSLQVGL